MARKKSVGRTNSIESSQPKSPRSEEKPVPLQSINPLAIKVYNPKIVQPIESLVLIEFDTSNKDQHVEENPDDEETLNVAENQNFEENPEDGEVRNNEKFSNVEENPTIKENPLVFEEESREINVDTFVTEIITKAQEESFVGSSKRQKMMERKNVPS